MSDDNQELKWVSNWNPKGPMNHFICLTPSNVKRDPDHVIFLDTAISDITKRNERLRIAF